MNGDSQKLVYRADCKKFQNSESKNDDEIDISDPNVSLVDKWKAHYYGTAKQSNYGLSTHFSSCYFVFIVLMSLYNITQILIDFHYHWASDWFLYCYKLFISFICVQLLLNWWLVRKFPTTFTKLDERNDLLKGMNGANENQDVYCCRCDLYSNAELKVHHCKVCDQCIIRRDHHCYLVATCIGHYNQRYFVVLTFYTGFGSLWALWFIISYLSPVVSNLEGHSWTGYILPISVYNYVTGLYTFSQLIMIIQCYTFLWTGPMATGFFIWQMIVIYQGITTYELKKSIRPRASRIYPTGDLNKNFRLIFGPCWILNFFFPMILVCKQPRVEKMVLTNMSYQV